MSDHAKPTPATKGKVKFFNDGKGYGFIKVLDEEDNETEKEVFVHQSKIRMEGHRTLCENQIVWMDYYNETKGLKAEDVVPDEKWLDEHPEARNPERREGGGNRDGYRGGGGGGYGGGGGGYGSRGGGGYGDRGYGGQRRDGGYSDRGYGGGSRGGYGDQYGGGGGGYYNDGGESYGRY